MSQQLSTDFPIDPNSTSGTALADILNRQNDAILTNNSGAAPPPSTQAGMIWLDTSSGEGTLKMRNAANSGWLTLGTMSGGGFVSALADGTQAAPGLAWANEPGSGWYRPSARVRYYSSQNAVTEGLDASVDLQTTVTYMPRAGAGSSVVTMRNQPAGAANYNQAVLRCNSDGNVQIYAEGVGGASAGGIWYTAREHIFAGTVRLPVGNVTGVVQNGGGHGISMDWDNANLTVTVDGVPFGTTWPINVSGGAATLFNGGQPANGAMVFTWAEGGTNPGWLWGGNDPGNIKVFSPSGLSVGYASNAGALAGTPITGVVRGDVMQIAGFASGDFNNPYMRIGDAGSGGIRYVIFDTNGGRDPRSIRNSSDGSTRYLETSGSAGTFGIYYNVSDERLKSKIAQADVDGTAAVLAMQLIEYDIAFAKDAEPAHVALGFSADNLQDISPDLVFAVEQQEDSPFASLGSILHVNGGVVSAYIAKALQETIARVEALEAAQ